MAKESNKDRIHKEHLQDPAGWNALVESIPDPISRFDLDLKFSYVNLEFLRISGKQKYEIIGKTNEEVFPEEQWTTAWVKILKNVLLTGKSDEMETHYRMGYMCTKVVPEFDFNGSIRSLLAIGRDMTAQKKIEFALEETKRLMSSILSNTMSSIMVLKSVRKNDQIVDFEYVFVNEEALKSVSRQDLTGKFLLQEFPLAKDTDLFRNYVNVMETGIDYQEELDMSKYGTSVWSQVYAHKMENDLLVTYFDVTERKKNQQEIIQLKDEIAQKATDKYYSIFQSINEAVVVNELIFNDEGKVTDFRILEVNKEYQRQTGIVNAVGKLQSELFPNLENYWLEGFEQVAKTGEPWRTESFNVDLGRWYSAYISRIGRPDSRQIVAVFEDVSERKLHEKRQLLLYELSEVSNSISDPADLEDVTMKMTLDHFKADRCYYAEIDGDKAIVLRDAINGNLPSVAGIYPLGSFEIFRRIVCEKRPLVVYDSHTSEILDESLRQICIQSKVISFVDMPVIKNGKVVAVLCLLQSSPRNWTDAEIALTAEIAERTWTAIEKTKAEDNLLKSENNFRTLFNSMDEGYCIIQMLYNKLGEPYDWLFLQVNPAFEKHNGLTNATGKTMLEMVPDIEQKWMDIYGGVATTGESVRFEESSDALHRTFDLFAYRIGGPEERKVAVLFTDITERKKAERALRDSEARLIALVSAVPTAISLFDIEGKIIYSNKEMRHYMPFGIIPSGDKENSWSWQAWDQNGIFVDREQFPGARALRGEPVVPGMEMLFTHQNGKRTWTRVSAVPVESSDGRILGTVSVITDIDELKRTAEALSQSSQQLALSLDAAKMGIFEWNSDDKKLRLSQSSQEIYGLGGQEIILSNEEAYKLVHFEDIDMRKSVFEQPGVLTAYYHEYRIVRPTDGKMAWIAEKGKAYRDSFTGITTIRGVHWDITEKKKIEEALLSSERNLKELNENLEHQVQKRTKELMKLKIDQEKEKLNTIIFTQEQERARISEGLHDGVAQLLYAIQNRLQMVKYPGAKDDKELKLIKEILTEAIEDTRKISFELMPPVLKDYGLEVCLSNLIKKVVGDRVKLNWDVSILGRLPEQLEITIYRIVQEILNNILKHAKATEAGLSVKVSDKYVRLKAYDNGVGFSVKNTKKEYHGIGLQSIRNRVKLLNGKMQIISSPGEGTIIELQLPLKQK